MSYYDDFDIPSLINKQAELQENIRQAGELYNAIMENRLNELTLTDYQTKCIDLHRKGYIVGDQIYTLYSEVGAVISVAEFKVNQKAG